MYNLKSFDQLAEKVARAELYKVCGSTNWVDKMMYFFPFESEEILFRQSKNIWYARLSDEDYMEAFSNHPKIGDLESLKKKFADTGSWASTEQSGLANSKEEILKSLAVVNDLYFKKFGFIYIINASGKSAKELLRILKIRMEHQLQEEIEIAKGEQYKITLNRLNKLINLSGSFWNDGSQITTHVLDTSEGYPGKGICIKLKMNSVNGWQTIALGITDEDGRIGDLLPAGVHLEAGNYQMCFETKNYFIRQDKTVFYPQVLINFITFDKSHYHIPLLINPFGYSTYRGS